MKNLKACAGVPRPVGVRNGVPILGLVERATLN